MWVVMKEGSRRGLHFFKCFIEDSQEPQRGARDLFKDFVVIGGGEREVVFDFIKGSCVDFFIVHTKK